MPKSNQSLLLRLPVSMRERAMEIAREQGVSLNFFVASALAECLERLSGKAKEQQAGYSNNS